MKTHTNNTIVTIIGIAVIACGLSFYGGMKYGESQNSGRGAQFAAGQFGGMQNGGATGGARTAGTRTGMRGAGGMVSGEILSKDATSITVKDRTGGSKIVFLGSSAEVMKSTTGTMDDLIVGTNVITNGTPNADGSITATTVQIRPAGAPGSGGFPGGAPKGQ